ncbi:SDR family oxidoreductase [Pseudoalteromonas fenneropenaei]|uniref:SDR family oxidoreductase n=1 Tax=Pseudoalteromonas fenneropenaei TaxID=1737459 RepID=A0ABV7CG01_9GAMM
MSKPLAIITGATGGIGEAIARRLAQDNWRCLLVARSESALHALRYQLGDEHLFLALDLNDEAAPITIAQHAEAQGGATLLVNNAGLNQMLPFENTPPNLMRKQLQVNLLAPMLLTQMLLPQLKSCQGTVVNIGSAFGAIGYPYQSAYCASKFGLRGFSEALSRELDGVVAIKYLAPRATDTQINDAQVRAMNTALGNKMDSPQQVAEIFMQLLNSKQRRKAVGFPEKLFARINGLLPELVDSAIIKQLKTIKSFLGSRESSL